jgi:hypothetical protein
MPALAEEAASHDTFLPTLARLARGRNSAGKKGVTISMAVEMSRA